ncbi:MAG TPA: PAS domain S-box protein, partial [Methanocella sp.]|nr:PAS domain S-box protein [Methanocella sp.]
MTNEKILIVEDEGIVAEDLGERLKSLRYTVVGIADTGDKAIAMAGDLRPDLVLMDIRLKGKIDGIEAGRAIADSFAIPFIFLTAHSDEPTLQNAKLARPAGYLLKPVDNNAQIRSAIEVGLYRAAREKKLKQNEQWLNTVLRSMENGVVATDRSGQIVFMNPAACLLAGTSAQQAAGKPIDQVLEIKDINTGKTIPGLFARVLADEAYRTNKGSAILRSRDGYEVPVDFVASPNKDERGQRSGIMVVFNDISDKMKVEAALQVGERKYRSIIDAGGDGSISVDANNAITFANSNVASLLGHPPRFFVGRPIVSLLSQDSATRLQGLLTAAGNGRPRRCDCELKREDGTWVWAVLTINALTGTDGAYAGALIMVTDISEQKAREKEVKYALAQANLYLDTLDLKVGELHGEILDQLKAAGEMLTARGSIDKGHRQVVDRPYELVKAAMA